MRTRRLSAVAAIAAAAALTLAACSSGTAAPAGESTADADAGYPITIEHALGTTVIEAKPERVATVQWANHEVPLALGVVPVGMAAANFGDDDGDGILPWVSEKLEEFGGETPVLFDENDGIDFEAVANTDPDVILASYSGLTQEDYDTLSEIAPVVAYPDAPWSTSWRDTIEYNALGMGMAAEGEELIAEIEGEIDSVVAEHPQLEGKSAMFLTHVDPADLSEVSFYTPNDTRAAFFDDLGLTTPASVEEATGDSGEYSGTLSAEQADALADVDIIVTYSDAETIAAIKANPLLSQVPAIANDAIVMLGSDPLGTAANPTPLSISFVLEDYVDMLSAAADKVQ
jgi:iron complex transport system substrate-binding protein